MSLLYQVSHADHDCPVVELNLTPIRYKQKPREIPWYKSAKWDNISEDLLAASMQIQTNIDDKWVTEMPSESVHGLSFRTAEARN